MSVNRTPAYTFLLKLFVVLVFVSPFLYQPIQKITGVYQAWKLKRYRPVSESEVKGLERFHFTDFSNCANSDYHHNPFFPNPNSGSDHFPELQPGVYVSRKIPFKILRTIAATNQPSTLTTGENPYFSCEIPLPAVSSRAVHLALDGAWLGDGHSRIARLEVRYKDGTLESRILVANQDVWSYQTKSFQGRIPRKLILWEDRQGHHLVINSIPLDSSKVPEALEIWAMPSVGKEGKQPAVAIFSVTQEFKDEG